MQVCSVFLLKPSWTYNNTDVHSCDQVFLQSDVARPLRKAHKRKRDDAKKIMLDMRDIGGDWLDHGTVCSC
jgi:hypothetical protein